MMLYLGHLNVIDRAVYFARIKHALQVRKYTGEPYFNHLESVANMVRAAGGDDDMVAAAYLHDTLEDTDTKYVELVDNFGEKIADLVVELTNVYRSGTGGNRSERKMRERERLAKVSAAAQTIKVADLIDNTSSIVERDPGFAKVYLMEKAALLDVLTKADKGLLRKAWEAV